jgi:hypothetical protein
MVVVTILAVLGAFCVAGTDWPGILACVLAGIVAAVAVTAWIQSDLMGCIWPLVSLKGEGK